jgi:hypothetical protein
VNERVEQGACPSNALAGAVVYAVRGLFVRRGSGLLARLRYCPEGTTTVRLVTVRREAGLGSVAIALEDTSEGSQLLNSVELLVTLLVERVTDVLGFTPGGISADPVSIAIVILAEH